MDENTKEGVETPDKDLHNEQQTEETKAEETKTEAVKEAATGPSEFSQIVWPKAKRLWSETFTVVIVAAILAVIIFFVDLGLRSGIEVLIK